MSKLNTILLLVLLQTTLPGQTLTRLNHFSKTECIENCKENDTIYSWVFSNGLLKINFGRLETCNEYDTALIRTKSDTLRIRIGSKKHFKTYDLAGKPLLDFEGEAEEECDCFYKYSFEISNLYIEPKALIIDKDLYIGRKRLRVYSQFW